MIKCTRPYTYTFCQHYSVVNGEHICCNINPGCPYGIDDRYGDEIPNEVTLAAIEEMENGGGRLVDSVKDLFDELAED